MEPRHLATLRELRDRGSISAVAAALHVTPSSISQQIAALQRSAGVRLTRLEGRRTVLTAAGLALADAAVEVEVALTRARQTTADFGATTAPVSLCAFRGAALALFPELLAEQELPAVRLASEEAAGKDWARLALRYDLVVAERLYAGPPWPATVTVTTLLSEPLDLAVRVGHRFAGLRAVRPSDLLEAPWISLAEGSVTADAVRRIAGAAGRAPRILHEVHDSAVAIALIRASDAVSLLPRRLGPYDERIVTVPFTEEFAGALTRRIDVLSRPEVRARPCAERVIDALRRAASAR